jgi:LmbE family N-acetylglucosaminyl deacetylase
MELLCAGTLAKYAQQGAKVWIVTMSIGELGHKDIAPTDLKKIRRREASASAALIGAEYVCLYEQAEYMQDTTVARNKLVEVLRRAKADLVLTQSPVDYHLDHMNTSKVAHSATLSAPIPQIITDSKPLGWHPMLIYCDSLSGLDVQPTHYVDITSTFETKMAMLRCHKTQLKMDYWSESPISGLEEMMEIQARFRGMQSGVKYAEAFRPALTWPRFRAGNWLP